MLNRNRSEVVMAWSHRLWYSGISGSFCHSWDFATSSSITRTVGVQQRSGVLEASSSSSTSSLDDLMLRKQCVHICEIDSLPAKRFKLSIFATEALLKDSSIFRDQDLTRGQTISSKVWSYSKMTHHGMNQTRCEDKCCTWSRHLYLTNPMELVTQCFRHFHSPKMR